MSVRPIIFSASMVRALLDKTKTQTRRVLKGQPPEGAIYSGVHFACNEPDAWFFNSPHGHFKVRQSYAPGDLLWCREAWAPLDALTHNDPGTTALAFRGFYRAGGNTVDGEISRWRSPIRMPRWASRLTLRVTDVRVQRVQEISEADAQAEGVRRFGPEWSVEKDNGHGAGSNTAAGCFRILWNSIHGPDAWDANPWVCALTFDVIRANVDEVQG